MFTCPITPCYSYIKKFSLPLIYLNTKTKTHFPSCSTFLWTARPDLVEAVWLHWSHFIRILPNQTIHITQTYRPGEKNNQGFIKFLILIFIKSVG